DFRVKKYAFRSRPGGRAADWTRIGHGKGGRKLGGFAMMCIDIIAYIRYTVYTVTPAGYRHSRKRSHPVRGLCRKDHICQSGELPHHLGEKSWCERARPIFGLTLGPRLIAERPPALRR